MQDSHPCDDLKTSKILSEAGWFRGRQVATAQWRNMIEGEGYQAQARAMDFLGEFGGLSFVGARGQYSPSRYALDPMLADTFVELNSLYRAKFDVGINPLGEVGGSAILFLDETGRFVAFAGGKWFCLGEDTCDFFQRATYSNTQPMELG